MFSTALATALGGVLLLFFLFRASQRAKYLIKGTAYLFVLFFSAFWGSVYCIFFKGRNPNNHLVFGWFAHNLRLATILGIKYVFEGTEILSETESSPHVLVSNHQSSLDVLGMMLIWPKNTVSVAKKSLKYLPLFGTGASMSKTVFIDRVNREQARNVINEALKEEKLNLWIFPEGTRNHEEGMLPFKKGAFHAAVQAQVPIIPIVFSPYTFYDKKLMKFDSGTIKITVLKPIPTVGLTTDDVDELSLQVREQMLAIYRQRETDSAR